MNFLKVLTKLVAFLIVFCVAALISQVLFWLKAQPDRFIDSYFYITQGMRCDKEGVRSVVAPIQLKTVFFLLKQYENVYGGDRGFIPLNYQQSIQISDWLRCFDTKSEFESVLNARDAATLYWWGANMFATRGDLCSQSFQWQHKSLSLFENKKTRESYNDTGIVCDHLSNMTAIKMEILDEISGRSLREPLSHALVGNALFISGKYLNLAGESERAKTKLRLSLRVYPWKSETYVLLGSIYQAENVLEQYQLVKSECEKVFSDINSVCSTDSLP